MLRRTREANSSFGLSFLDVAFCALGGVLLLLLYAVNHQQQQAGTFIQTKEALEADLESGKKLIAGLTAEQKQLANNLDSANRELANIKSDMARKIAEMEAERRGANDAMKAAEVASKAQQNALSAQLADAKRGIAEANQALTDSKQDLQRATENLMRMRTGFAALRAQMSGVIGLKGEMKNVAFLFDTSESLSRIGNDLSAESRQRANVRYAEYKSLLAAWVTSLNFETFTVIEFNHMPREVPGWEGKLVSATQANRTEAVQFIDNLTPQYTTNTRAALAKAFALNGIDTIVLFSDGAPNDRENKSIRNDEEERATEAAQWILEYCQQANPDKRVTINTIAMGDYLDEIYGKFLQDLAKQNNGVFIGR